MTEGRQSLKNRLRDRAQYRAFFDVLPKDLPDHADDLGEPVAIHKTSKFIMIAGVCFGLFLLAGGVVVGILIAGAKEMRSTDANALSIAAGLAGLCGIGMAAFCFLKLRSPNVVVVFQDGFICARGSQVTVVPWAEIENVWESITEILFNGQQVTIFVYTVELANGEKLGFNSQLDSEVRDVRKLGRSIQEGVTRLQLPRALDRLQKGKAIEFGPLEINQKGVRYAEKFVPWQEIEETFVEEGNVIIRKLGQEHHWAKVAAADIPNVRVFLPMVDSFVSGSPIDTAPTSHPESPETNVGTLKAATFTQSGEARAADGAGAVADDDVGMKPDERIPNTRTYLHTKCSQATIVSGEDFLALADPFSGVSLTVCAACDGAFPLAEFSWRDTGENMEVARRRIAAAFPALPRFLNSYWFYGIFGIVCGGTAAAVSTRFPSQHVSSPWAELIWFSAGLFVGVVVYFGFLARPLMKVMMGPDFDFRKLR